MSDERMVLMTAEQYAEVERHVEELMRAKENERAASMMMLSLAYKFGKQLEPPLPDNVVELDVWSRKAPA